MSDRSPPGLRIAFFGSSLLSAYRNGAAVYYRGIIRGLSEIGHTVTFYEAHAPERQLHRDIDEPPWARVVVYDGESEAAARDALASAADADVLVKASGAGAFDSLLEAEILEQKRRDNLVVFWDIDAPATLEEAMKGSATGFRPLIPRFDLILTYGGGEPITRIYDALAAKCCVPVYSALDPTTHFPVPPQREFDCDLAFLGNRLPERERRVEEFLLRPAELLPDKSFLLAGSDWADKSAPPNVTRLGHVYTSQHNAFNATPLAVLNINRHGMAQFGYTPPTRIFEAAGAGACVITDAWEGIELFLEPGEEVLVATEGREVANLLGALTPERAAEIGAAARRRVLREHTFEKRAAQVSELFTSRLAPGSPRTARLRHSAVTAGSRSGADRSPQGAADADAGRAQGG